MEFLDEIKKELRKLGMTDFSEFDKCETIETIKAMIFYKGYKACGDAQTNLWAIEEALKLFFDLYTDPFWA